jgi:hypothetical protein
MRPDVASRENMGLIRSAHEGRGYYQHDTSLSGRKEAAFCPPSHFVEEDALMACPFVCPPLRKFEILEVF